MRIMFTGAAPWSNSGYSKPLRYLLPKLQELGHTLALCTFYGYQGKVTDTEVGGAPVRMYPPAKEPFFNDIIEHHASHFDADVVVSLQDVWILDGWGKRGFRWCPWMPIDCLSLTGPTAHALEECTMPLPFSKWGEGILRQAGWSEAKHIPFGVDLEVHQPTDKAMARAEMGLPTEGFIAGMVAGNASYPSRKSFAEVLLAWREWLDGGGEGILYIHATLQPKRKDGVLLSAMCDSLGLAWADLDDPEGIEGADVVFPSQYRNWCGGYGDEALATLYNSFDVLLSPSQSEGFGIPILEAQACGVPVITLKTTAMPEITFSGLCLEPVQLTWHKRGGWRGLVGVKDLAEAITWAAEVLRTPTGSQHYSAKARAGAMAFDWDKVVAEYWVPFLEEISESDAN